MHFNHYMRIFSVSKKNAKVRNIEFKLTEKQYKELVINSCGVCSLTGIPFNFTNNTYKRNPFSASIDRIDSTKGYFVGNVRLVCVAVNIALNEWGLDVLKRISERLIEKSSVEINNACIDKNNETNLVSLDSVNVDVNDNIEPHYGDCVLNEKQVSDKIGLSVHTLRSWRHHCKGLNYIKLGKRVFYKSSEVDKYLENNCVNHSLV